MKRSLFVSILLVGGLIVPAGASSEIRATPTPLIVQSKVFKVKRDACTNRCDDIYQLDMMSCREENLVMPSRTGYAVCVFEAAFNANRCVVRCRERTEDSIGW